MNQPIGLYLHIPFCDGKCYYCGFFSEKRDNRFIDRYVAHMKDAIRAFSQQILRPVRTVYFGGGTPSLIGHSRLADLLRTVFDCFDVLDGVEITAEINPSGCGTMDFSVLKSAGFNRLSIGLQSANDTELRLLGRRHTVDDVTHTIEAAQDAGFDNLSLDVMLAIPGQTIASLSQTLAYCAERNAQHISAYILKIEEGTRFYRERDSLPLFDEEAQAGFYEYTVKRIAELGYPQYEISNFARVGYESKHNLIYWHDEEYLGIGPSAHSFLDGRRFFYPDDFDAFFADRTEYESSGGDSKEYIMLALRLTEGLIFERYQERNYEPLREGFFAAAKKLEQSGLAKLTPSSLSLTTKGFLVSNAVIAYLLEST